jgi:hypothetical protein
MKANDHRQDLDALRIAARQREWTRLQDTLKRLLAQLDPLLALTIPAERAREFLPVFEGHYPDARWVRELLLTVISYASAPRELPEHAVNQFPAPGCGNFVLGVFDLARAVQMEHTVFERFSFITNATGSLILADLQHTYFTAHPEDFARLVDPDATVEAVAQIRYRFWLDDDVAARDTSLWLAIAAEVEKRLTGE